VDPNRIFVLGHSLGGMLVPRIAAAEPSAAGFIVMAGAVRPLEQALVEQSRYLAMADGTISVEERAQIDQFEHMATRVAALRLADASATDRIFGVAAAYWLDLRGYDPPAAASEMKRPMLVLQGERDYQVTMAEFNRWRSTLADRPDVAFRSYPSLNHLFVAGTGMSLPAEYNTPGHVSEDVVHDIASWIMDVAPRRQ
jgi:dienelactone hydrolase